MLMLIIAIPALALAFTLAPAVAVNLLLNRGFRRQVEDVPDSGAPISVGPASCTRLA